MDRGGAGFWEAGGLLAPSTAGVGAGLRARSAGMRTRGSLQSAVGSARGEAGTGWSPLGAPATTPRPMHVPPGERPATVTGNPRACQGASLAGGAGRGARRPGATGPADLGPRPPRRARNARMRRLAFPATEKAPPPRTRRMPRPAWRDNAERGEGGRAGPCRARGRADGGMGRAGRAPPRSPRGAHAPDHR